MVVNRVSAEDDRAASRGNDRLKLAAAFRRQVQLPAPGVTIAIERGRDRDLGPSW